MINQKTVTHKEFLRLKNNPTKLDNYQNGFSDWLLKYDFRTFATFTTQKELSLAGARRMAEKFARTIQAGKETSMFWAAEKFDTRQGYHFHGLLNTAGFCSNYSMWYHWTVYKGFGRSQFLEITRKFNNPDQTKAVEMYIVKYLTKNISDYDIYTKKKIYDLDNSSSTGIPERPTIIDPFNNKNTIE